ncbi:MAG TPA: hypothetical protein VF974_01755 [Patescibacteria group bacterium]
MTLEQIKQNIQGEWVSIAPEIWPSAVSNILMFKYLRKNVAHNSTFVSLTLPGPEVI